MNIRPQQPIRELHHRIAQIDDRVARQRSHVAPFRILARREDLQAAEPVEEDRDAAEVGVFA